MNNANPVLEYNKLLYSFTPTSLPQVDPTLRALISRVLPPLHVASSHLNNRVAHPIAPNVPLHVTTPKVHQDKITQQHECVNNNIVDKWVLEPTPSWTTLNLELEITMFSDGGDAGTDVPLQLDDLPLSISPQINYTLKVGTTRKAEADASRLLFLVRLDVLDEEGKPINYVSGCQESCLLVTTAYSSAHTKDLVFSAPFVGTYPKQISLRLQFFSFRDTSQPLLTAKTQRSIKFDAVTTAVAATTAVTTATTNTTTTGDKRKRSEMSTSENGGEGSIRKRRAAAGQMVVMAKLVRQVELLASMQPKLREEDKPLANKLLKSTVLKSRNTSQQQPRTTTEHRTSGTNTVQSTVGQG